MMTERKPEDVAAGLSELCQAGYRSHKQQCWRKATEKIIPERPYPEVCAEHMRAICLGAEVSELEADLENVQEWIASRVDGPNETILQPHAWEMRATLEAKYWSLYVALKTAERIASFGPGQQKRISPEAAREFTELLERTHAVEVALSILEDAPREMFGAIERWEIVGGLGAIRDELNEEFGRTKERIGL